MPNYIVSANLNILNGILQGTMEFAPGLNVISGENGTLKTQVLHALRGGAAVSSIAGQTLRMQSISPKRNSERRTAEGILQAFRQSSRTWEANLSERVNAQINLSGFDNYPSIGDLYYLIFDHRRKDGTDQHIHMENVASEFNKVINAVFPNYRLVANWDGALGAPKIRMSKNDDVEFPIESLSMGEQEVLSLVLNVHTSRENVDVYLVDEPEVHLNWHLEDLLFSFLDDFCVAHQKQAIIVTHSRTIFKSRFLPKVQFLSWGEDKKVTWGRELTRKQRSRLAGDAIEIVALGDFSKITVFVEDEMHTKVVGALADMLNVSVNTSLCSSATNVKSLYRHQRLHGPWTNAYFLIDGDNQGNPFPDDDHFIHLPYYCIENLLLDPEILSSVSSRSVDDVRNVMVAVVKDKRNVIFQKNKFFEFLADGLAAEHMTFERLRAFDASVVLNDIIERLGLVSLSELLPKYLRAAQSAGRLDSLIPSQLLRALRSAVAIEEGTVQSDDGKSATTPQTNVPVCEAG